MSDSRVAQMADFHPSIGLAVPSLEAAVRSTIILHTRLRGHVHNGSSCRGTICFFIVRCHLAHSLARRVSDFGTCLRVRVR